MTHLGEIIDRSRQVNARFQKLNRREWTAETWLIELSKQVGELAQQTLMFEKYYTGDREALPQYAASLESIGNELADIVHAVVMIADCYGVDLEQSILNARADEMRDLDKLEQRSEPEQEDGK